MYPLSVKFSLFKFVNNLLLTILILSFASVLSAQRSVSIDQLGGSPTLGMYSDKVLGLSGNITVTPTMGPSSASHVTVKTSANFKGVLSVNSSNGIVTITNAAPAGVYTVEVTAHNGPTLSTTRTFQMTVQTVTGCSPFSASGNFSPATDSPFATESTPQLSETGDFNNDGIQDIAVANADSATVSVLTGTGTGSFNAAVNIATDGTGPQFLTVNDFNGDGNQDFAVGNVVSGTVSVLLGDGAVGFTQAMGSPFSTGGDTPRGIISADFDGDGRTDLAVTHRGFDDVAIFLGDGTGEFATAPGSPIPVGNQPSGMVKGDFNNDAVLDLAVVNSADDTLSILLGNGNGTFTISFVQPVNPFPLTASVADLNNDGFQDIVVDSFNSNNVSILLGDGTGAFTAGTSVNVGFDTYGITAADLNGDGNADFLASQKNANPGAASLQLGVGDGTFTSGGTIGDLATSRGLTVGDFNGDDRQDIVVVERNGDRIASYLGGCAVDITNTSLPNGSQDAAYNVVINATGGTAPYTFSATGLPTGLMFNTATGEITGSPTVTGTFYPRFTVTDSSPIAPSQKSISLAPAAANVNFQVLQIVVLAPTAANASISGKVQTALGRGIPRATVSITDASGQIRYARTNQFGYFHFEDVGVGETYVFNAYSKQYTFATQVLSVDDNITGLNFTAQ